MPQPPLKRYNPIQLDRTKNLVRVPLGPTGATRRLQVTFGADAVGAVNLDDEHHIQLIDIFDATRQLPALVDGRVKEFATYLRPRDDAFVIEFTPGTAANPPAHQDVFSIEVRDPTPRSAQVLTFLYDDDDVLNGLVVWHARHFLHPSMFAAA
jgi:hypothetical protein